MELRRVREGDLRGLRGHGVGDGLNAVSNADDGRLAGSVQVFLPVGGKNPAAFAANGGGERFLEIAREEGGHEKDCSKGRKC